MFNPTLSAFADEIDPSLSKQIEVLKKHNINHIELRSIDGVNVSKFTPQYAKETKKILDAEGMKISAIGSPIGKIKIDDDFCEHLDLFKRVLELADIFETKYIRMFSFFLPEGSNFDDYSSQVIDKLAKMVDVAMPHNVTLLHENEKDIYGDVAKRCYKLLSAINNPKLRATFDPANFVQCGEVVYPDAYEFLKNYVEYVHIKDARRSDHVVVPAGHGDGCFKELFEQLKKNHYQGFITLEPHLGNFVGFADLETDLSNAPEGESDENKFAIAVEALKKFL